jgi:hypothetical protein
VEVGDSHIKITGGGYATSRVLPLAPAPSSLLPAAAPRAPDTRAGRQAALPGGLASAAGAASQA